MKIDRKVIDQKNNIVQVTTEDERWYLIDGEYVPSVTWIASHYPKGIGFYKWLANTGWDESEALKNAAGNRGSRVHKAIELLVNGESIGHNAVIDANGEVGELTVDEYEAIISFANWWKVTNPKLISSEFTTHSKEYGYAGTIDLLLEINGEKWIVDIKTSSEVWPEHELQLSAYAHSENVENIGIIQVGYKRNKNKYKFTQLTDKFDLFLAAKKIWFEECSKQSPYQRDLPLSISL